MWSDSSALLPRAQPGAQVQASVPPYTPLLFLQTSLFLFCPLTQKPQALLQQDPAEFETLLHWGSLLPYGLVLRHPTA